MTQTTVGTVGPIIFADATARGQLQEHGEVVTFRKSERTTGDTWWRTSRLGPKKGDVRVEEVGEVSPRNDEVMGEFVHLSGFDSVDIWRQKIRELNGALPAKGFLYRVTTSE